MNKFSLQTKKYIMAGVITFLVSIIYICIDMVTFTVRNGQEYMDVLNAGEFYEQEISLYHTTKLNIDVSASYEKSNPDAGIKVTIDVEDEKKEQFYSLQELPNERWGNLTVNIFDKIKYVGKATLKIELVDALEEDKIYFLIVTNDLQTNPENKLFKSGIEQPGSRLNMNINHWKLDISLVSILVLAFAFSYIAVVLIDCIKRKQFTISNFVLLCVLFCLLGIVVQKFSFLSLNKHTSAQYFLSWQNLGFQKRSLIGTLVNQFIPNMNILGYRLLGISINLILLVLELLVLPIKSNNLNKKLLYSVFVFFMCTPFYVSTYFLPDFFARLDVYLAILFLTTCLVIIRGKTLILIPILTIVGLLIHEMYLPMFMPFIFILLLYKFTLCHERKYVYILGGTSVGAISLGGYLSWRTAVDKPFELAWKFIQEKFNPDLIWEFPLEINFYTETSQYKYQNWIDLMRNNIISHFLLSVFLLLPIVILFVKWFKTYLGNQREKDKKLAIMLFPCSLAGLFVCMFACDWGRWQALYGIGIFFTFMAWWNMDVDGVQKSIESVLKDIKYRYGKYSIKILLITYFTLTYIYGKGGATSVSIYGKVSEHIISFIRTFFATVKL